MSLNVVAWLLSLFISIGYDLFAFACDYPTIQRLRDHAVSAFIGAHTLPPFSSLGLRSHVRFLDKPIFCEGSSRV